MKVEIIIKKEVEAKTVEVKAAARYWEDAVVNGEPDEDGSRIPCRQGEMWCPIIDIDSGIITNWQKGVKADIHFKVCDEGSYFVKDENGEVILKIENDYVPNELIPGSYGDYIIMTIDENGLIAEWNPSFDDFFPDND